jgi:hypothetical protein
MCTAVEAEYFRVLRLRVIVRMLCRAGIQQACRCLLYSFVFSLLSKNMSVQTTMGLAVATWPTVRNTHVTLKTASKQNGNVQSVR